MFDGKRVALGLKLRTIRLQTVSVHLSPGFKNESYPLQREFQNFMNFAWISRGFHVAFGRVEKIE